MLYRLTNFRLIVVKLYYVEETDKSTLTTSQDDTLSNITITVNYPKEDTIIVDHLTKRGRGRPKGSKNKQYLIALDLFLLAKEKGDLELLLKL